MFLSSFFFLMMIYAAQLQAQPLFTSLEKSPNKETYHYSDNILLEVVSFEQAIKLFRWLDNIQLTQIGRETLDAIRNSQHKLVIAHSKRALWSAGITGAPLSKRLTNGQGDNVYIKFYLDMKFHGSNCVLGDQGNYIDYSAVHNLFHELSHARHKMNGTWLYFDSEGQAIREENIFREQWAEYRLEKTALRSEDIEEERLVLRTSSCSAIL